MSRHVLPDAPVTPTKPKTPKSRVYNIKKKPYTLANGPPPPPNELESLVGPNGMRFMDMRMNRKVADLKAKGGVKRLMCFV